MWTKVLLLLTGAAASKMAFTSPNATPKDDEQGRFGKKDPGSQIGHALHIIMKPLASSFILLEILSLLAGQFPTVIPTPLLSLFDFPSLSSAHLTVHIVYLLGFALIITGALIRVECFRTLGRFFTFELSVKDDHKLITIGPYSVVRHPSYAGTLMVASGNLICAFAPGSWFVEYGVGCTVLGKVMAAVLCVGWGFFFVSVPLRIKKEDEVFRKQFGAEWEAWAKQTRYRIIPYVF